MNINVDNLTVEQNEDAGRFEIRLEESVAFADYRLRNGTDGVQEIVFPHTVVPPEFGGQGVGSRLVRGALDYAREQNLRVVPICPFVASYIKRHPDYQDLTETAI